MNPSSYKESLLKWQESLAELINGLDGSSEASRIPEVTTPFSGESRQLGLRHATSIIQESERRNIILDSVTFRR